MGFYSSLENWLIPPAVRQPALVHSQAKNLVGVTLVAAVTVPFYALFYYYLNSPMDSMILIICGVFMMLSLLPLKLSGSIKRSQTLFIISCYMVLTLLTFSQGGILSPVTYWLTIIPVLGMFLSGIKAGFWWGLGASAGIMLLYGMQVSGYPMPVSQVDNVLLLQFVATITLLIVMFCIVLIFEISKRQVFTELETAINERIKSEKKLAFLAHYDQLTGLPNRLLYEIKLNGMIERAKAHNKKIVILYLDLDHFKYINDTLGHAMGDLFLREVSEVIKSTIHGDGFISRLGGDEFAIVLENVKELNETVKVTHNIMRALNKPVILNDYEAFTSTSIGIAVFPDNGMDSITLTKCADIAMYQAKEKGRNIYQYYDEELHKAVSYQIAIDTQLNSAIKNHELFILYQPQYDVRTKKIIGIEALMRWNNALLGELNTEVFIPIAEKNGMIKQFGEWILRHAGKQFKVWRQESLIDEHVKIAINLSIVQIMQENFIQRITSVLDEARIDPRYIELELTETSIMHDPERALKTLLQLEKLGFQIAIDDFGTGYSSLNRLKNLPIHTLKIDKSFVLECTNSYEDASIVKSIIALGHGLGMTVIAEGVENRGQLDFVASNGCDYVQGFYFNPPLPAENITRLLRTLKPEEVL